VVSFRNGPLVFPVLDEGSGPPVVLLHGFPQDASSWDAVAPLLHAQGLRTLRPDQRGYAATARPQSTSDYRLPHLVGDVVALLDAAGLERAHVVGHDWGGAVAWALACSEPGRVETLTVLSTPHPAAFLRSFLTSTQGLHSAYMIPFQPPGLAEWWLGGPSNGGRVRALLQPFGAPPAAVETAVRLMADRDRLRAMLQWYRALPRSVDSTARAHSTVPTTYVWSTRDGALGRAAAEQTARYVDGPYRFEVLEGLSHWLPEEAPETVATLITDRVLARR
jgi:pimeloyl-ACP methyl ester carboxylesterase